MKTSDTKKGALTKRQIAAILITIIIVLMLYVLNGLYLVNKDPIVRGTLGDMFGVVNALFSGLAFAGIIFTILLQRNELQLQREELGETRKEFEQQNKTLKQQAFDNFFFQLIRNHQDIVNGIDIRGHVKTTRDYNLRYMGEKSTTQYAVISQGRDCFKTFYSDFKTRVKGIETIEKILEVYLRFYHTKQSDLGHYFRNVYHIVKYIDKSEAIEDYEKFTYTSLLRALLSSYELALLFYNGLGEYGIEFFAPLIEKYSLLKNLDPELLISITHKNEYHELAFADSKQRVTLLETWEDKRPWKTNNSKT